MNYLKYFLFLSLFSLNIFIGGCSSTSQIIARDYSSSRALLKDYLQVPKLEMTGDFNEISPDQKTYAIAYELEKLPSDVAFRISSRWEVNTEGKLTFVVMRNSTYPTLGPESLILKEFFDSLFTFTDSPEQGLDFFSRVLSGEIAAIDEHVKRRVKNIDFQPAATLLDDYYPNTYLPALRSVLNLTAKWKRFEKNKRFSSDSKTPASWQELVSAWTENGDPEIIKSYISGHNLSRSFEHYLELMYQARASDQKDRVLMFYPVQERDQDSMIEAEGIANQKFTLKPNVSLIDLVKEQNDMEDTSMFLNLFTTLSQASRYGAWGVAAVWVDPRLLLAQNQGLFSQNKWLYPIGVRESAIFFKAAPKDLRLSKDNKGEPRLSYFIEANQKVKLMQSFESTDEFRYFARGLWLKYYLDLAKN